MEDELEEVQAGPVVKVARDLTEILALDATLLAQAVNKASAKVDGTALAGGYSMVALGNVANMEAWENLHQATERHEAGVQGYRRAYTSVEDEDPDDGWSAFQLLEFWSEQWRAIHGAEYGRRPTIATEANFIRWALDWAWDNEPQWDDFARDVNRARVALENILYAGRRQERTRVVCSECDDAPRLLVLRGHNEDTWKCPACRQRYDGDGLRKAHAKQLRKDAAARFVDQGDAIATLAAQGRPERTVRAWLAPLSPRDKCEVCAEVWPHQENPACPKVLPNGDECGGIMHTIWAGDREAILEGYCELGTRRRLVWWPDLWHKHLATPTRKRPETA